MSPDDIIPFTRQQVTNMLNGMLSRDPICALLLQKLNEPPPPAMESDPVKQPLVDPA